MKLKRYFTNANLEKDIIVEIDGDEFHHMKNVMRTNVNDHVLLFNGTNIDAEGVVQSIQKNKAVIKILDTHINSNEPKINVTLYQAVRKGEKLSLITQKITELGASNMVVFYSDYTDIKEKTNKLDKLQKVSISASKQCGRSSILNIQGVVSFETMTSLLSKHQKVFVAYENSTGFSLYDSLSSNNNLENIAIVIGAEGGFSEKEINILEELNCEIVTLGKRILRTETASIVSVAQIMFACEK